MLWVETEQPHVFIADAFQHVVRSCSAKRVTLARSRFGVFLHVVGRTA